MLYSSVNPIWLSRVKRMKAVLFMNNCDVFDFVVDERSSVEYKSSHFAAADMS